MVITFLDLHLRVFRSQFLLLVPFESSLKKAETWEPAVVTERTSKKVSIPAGRHSNMSSLKMERKLEGSTS